MANKISAADLKIPPAVVVVKIHFDDFDSSAVHVNDVNQNVKQQTESEIGRSASLKSYTGIVLTLLAGLLYTVSVLLVKMLPNYHPFSLSVWRYLAFILPSILMCLYSTYVRKENVVEHFWPIFGEENSRNGHRKMFSTLLISAILSGAGLILRFYALNYLSLADATAITFSGPVFAVIFAHVFLKENCGWTTIPIALWTLLGVFIIVKPPILTGESEFDQNALIGAGISIASVFTGAAYYVIMRKLKTIHLSIVLLLNGLMGFIESVIIAYACGVVTIPKGFRDILLTVLMSFISFLGNLVIVLALKYEKAGTVSLVRTTDVLFAFLWQLIFLNVVPDLYSYLGAAIITSGVLLVTIKRWISEIEPDNRRLTKIYKCLTR